jgi:hypothetical protein
MDSATQRALELMINAKIARGNQNLENPYTTALATGLGKGLEKGQALYDEKQKEGLKVALEDKIKTKQNKYEFVKENWKNYDHYINENGTKRLATTGESLQGMEMALEGKDFPGMISMPKVTRTYQTEGEKLDEQITRGQDPATIARIRKSESKPNEDEDLFTDEAATTIEEPIKPKIPFSVPKAVSVAIEPFKAVGRMMGYGNTPQRLAQPNIPTQPVAQTTPAVNPQTVVSTVKEIGNAALKAHYKFSATNPQTGEKLYSDDNIKWFNEAGKPIN